MPLILTIFVCIQFGIHYMWKGNPFLNLEQFTQERVSMPYQGRILTAWIFQLTAARPSVAHAVAGMGQGLPLALRSPYLLVELVLVISALFAASLACRATTLLLCDGNQAFADWSLLLVPAMLIFLNFFESYGFYAIPYDLPSLAFFSAGIWLVVAKRNILLIPLFVLGTLNRETFIFITLFLLLYTACAAREQRRPILPALRPTLPYAGLQIVAWIAIRIWLMRRFAHNTGAVAKHGFILQLGGNLRSVVNPFQWPALVNLAALFVLPMLLGWPWITNRAFAKATAVILVLWTAGMLVVGVFLEVRVFTELISFVAPCLAMAIWTRFAQPARFAVPQERLL